MEQYRAVHPQRGYIGVTLDYLKSLDSKADVRIVRTSHNSYCIEKGDWRKNGPGALPTKGGC